MWWGQQHDPHLVVAVVPLKRVNSFEWQPDLRGDLLRLIEITPELQGLYSSREAADASLFRINAISSQAVLSIPHT